MRIAVLGWGSLIWNCQELAILGCFRPDGPRLPIEFSRVSRNGRLTLVIDGLFGVGCVTYVAPSAHKDLTDAIENLRVREETVTKNVGAVVARSHKIANATEHSSIAASTVRNWIETSGYDAAIWTALGSNFQQKTGKAFSVEAAVQYLESINPSRLDVALDYVRRAPPEVRTPLRSAVNSRWPEDDSKFHHRTITAKLVR